MRPILSLTVLAAVTAFAKVPLDHETMWRMKRVGPPSLSPNGKWVVVSVTEPAYDPAEQVSDLWLVPSDGSLPPRRLTATRAAESDVAWSADSRRIVFVSKRDVDVDPQAYLLELAGGEAQRLTSFAGGVSAPKPSPDGKRLLFQADFDPIASERSKRKYKARAFDSFPIRHWDRWLDEKRPRLFVQALEPGATARDLLAGTMLAAEAGFDGQLGNTGSDLGAIWAPDSRSIVFHATTTRNTMAYLPVGSHLYRADPEGGEPQRLTDGTDSFTNPVFRPDGKALYADHDPNHRPYNLSRVAKIDWPGSGKPAIVTRLLDRAVSSFAFSDSSRTLLVLAEEAGHEKLYSLPAEGGEAKLAFEMKLGTFVNIRSANGVVVANWESSINPLEVVRIDAAAGTHFPLTRFNAAASEQIDWQAPRHFTFTAKNGRRIHNMLFLPPAFDAGRKYPLIQFIHGGPHTMSRDQFHTRWNYHLLTAPGYVVLTTNYTGSTGFGEKFAQAIERDPLQGPGRELEEAVDEAIRLFPFVDSSRLAAGGASYGGHLANWLQGTSTRFKCLFSHAGLINLESQWGTSDVIYHREVNNGGPVWEQGPVWREQNPIRHAARFRTPILLTVGEKDYRVPLNQTIENWSVLQRLRIPSRLLVFPDENHWVRGGENSRYFFEELHAWLRRWL
jgi:dipeptidyl aminopeptidase/acylaminoacyl peptidase